MSITLLPAYGRDYTSKTAVLADFNANKDFVIIEWNQKITYINKEQIDAGSKVWFRYARQRKIFEHTV
jgi:hypothetical protein